MIRGGQRGERCKKYFNLGKKFNSKLAADTIRVVTDSSGLDSVLYVFKAMIRCGMPLIANGRLEVEQIFSKLQNNVKAYPEAFNGTATQ